eukprot:TRINITY_DN53508_c0_g1_i1.p2 TRINITY_DN53508_c0_g1~~TRINITY_DN53508_c0_g1_i1.p2  ORF type:complete len:192 (-),score=111.54 TRINITY_DN53508_c0_g1_i1:1563-2087(-)
MKVYIDLMNGSELCSDAQKIEEVKEYDGAVFKVQSKQIIEGNDDIDIGANPSAEEQAEALADGATQVINLVSAHKLQKMEMDKKEYKALQKMWFKKFLGWLKENDESKVAEYKKVFPKLQEFYKMVIKNFDDFEFYIGELATLENGIIIPARWEDGGMAPVFYYYPIAMKEEKY